MKSKKRLHFFLLFLWVLLAQSCIDNKYNLDNLPDNLIVAGDSITLPVGITDSLFLKEFMKDQNVDNLQEIDNIFYLIQSGSIDLSLPTGDLNISNTAPITASANTKPNNLIIDGQWYPTSNPNIPVISGTTDKIAIQPSNNTVIKRIDKVEFKDGAYLNINVKLKGTEFDKSIYLLVSIPAGLTLQEENGSSIALINGKYSIEISKTTQEINKRLKIKSLINTGEINFNYNIDFNSAQIKYLSSSSEKSFNMSITATNLNVDKFYGQIDYSGSKQGISANISSLYKDLFKNQTDVISISNPQLIIDSESAFGIPFLATLSVSAKKNNIPISLSGSTSTSINIDAPATLGNTISNHFEIGNSKLNFSNIIKAKPDSIDVNINYNSISDLANNGWGSTSKPHFITSSSTGKVNYKFKMPLAFENDFQLSYSDTIADVFDQDIKEYLFSTGEVKITGTVISTIPLNAQLSFSVISSEKNEQTVNLSATTDINAYSGPETNGVRKAISSPFSIVIKAEELNAMKSPNDLIAKIKLTSNSSIQGRAIKSTDFIFLKNVKIIKTGGISISTK